jgi:hypothetical protein
MGHMLYQKVGHVFFVSTWRFRQIPRLQSIPYFLTVKMLPYDDNRLRPKQIILHSALRRLVFRELREKVTV